MDINKGIEFIKKNKHWLFLLLAFVMVRVIVFWSFWNASIPLGGWSNFFSPTDLWMNALDYKHLYRSICGGLPLYFTFTSIAQLVINGQWGIYIAQSVLALIVFVYSYKLINLFFGQKLAYLTVLLMAIDPYLAWFNFIIASENLFFVFFIGAVYYFFLFLKTETKKSFILFALLLSLSAITRTNAVFFSILFSILFLFFYFLRNQDFGVLKNIKISEVFKCLVFLNFTFLVFCGGVMLLNKYDHDDYRMDAAFSSNVYFFNVPALHAQIQGISFSEAKENLIKKANSDLGFETGSLSCLATGNDNYNKLLHYASAKGKEYIKADIFAYTKIHFIKMIPFFFQSTYYHMYELYTGKSDKPDMSSAILSGNIGELIVFLKNVNTGLMLYLGGMIIWGMASLSILFSLVHSFIYNKKLFSFFVVISVLVLYSAFMVSPFSMPRYRLPLYPFFIISVLYCAQLMYLKYKNKKNI